MPSGGRAFVYHLVDILTRNGFDAYVLHQKENFRYSWFENTVPVRWTHQIKRSRLETLEQWGKFHLDRLREHRVNTPTVTDAVTVDSKDVLVIPETRAHLFSRTLPGVPKIILNQNPYFFAQNAGLKTPEISIYHPDIKGCIAMSKIDYEIHRLIVPDNIWYVPYFIDADRYRYSRTKKRQIAYMPRRLKEDSDAVTNLLKLRDNLKGFTFVPIQDVNQQQVAEVMKESLIFLSFSNREGFGLPPAEAMACGCIVIGYSGNGGDEFFDKGVAIKVPYGDLVKYINSVERTIADYERDPGNLDRFRLRASNYILQTYSKDKTRDCLLSAWNEIKNIER